MRGRRFCTSIAIPTNELATHSASAPARSTAQAIAPMSVTPGVSFTISGRLVDPRTASVTAAAAAGSRPNSIPPTSRLGQEMFTSSPATPAAPSSASASRANSPTVSPSMFTTTGVSHVSQTGATSRSSRETPMF